MDDSDLERYQRKVTPPPNIKDYQIIYPHFLNAALSRSQGRRIAIHQALEKPTVLEIMKVCENLGLPCLLEISKFYPRSQGKSPVLVLRGRVRVLLKSFDEVAGKKSYSLSDILSKGDFLVLLRNQMKEGRAVWENAPPSTWMPNTKDKKRK